MTGYYNLALRPDDEELSRICIELAQTNVGAQARDYMLGSNCLAHVTICQFHSEAEQLPKIWASFADLRVPSLRFTHVYIKPGLGRDAHIRWVGLAVAPTEVLLSMQRTVYSKLGQFGIKGITLPETYFPHLTWARCDETPITIKTLPSRAIWDEHFSFTLSIGRSDQLGVYHEQLYILK